MTTKISSCEWFLLWVDENIDLDNIECQKAISRFEQIIERVDVCTTSSQCIRILSGINNKRISIVTSGVLGQDVLPNIHDMPYVDAIFIFCNNKARYDTWAKQWTKIQGVFTAIQPICDSLKEIINVKMN